MHYFKISLIHTDDGHSKFWSAMLGFSDSMLPVVKVSYGKIGTKGADLKYPRASHKASFKFFMSKVEEKLRKGYRLDDANTPKVIVLFAEVDGRPIDPKIVNEVRSVAGELKTFMKMHFGREMTIVNKDEEMTVDDVRPSKKPEPANKLQDMMKRRKAEAKFVF